MVNRIKLVKSNSNFTMERSVIHASKVKGKRYVIPDIHGCLKTFKALVDRINLSSMDRLYLLGDYVDRGPDSRGVIDYILFLKDQISVFPLLGNHEENLFLLLSLNNERLIEKYVNSAKGRTLFNPDKSLDQKYINFLRELPVYMKLNHFYLVHAGFDFSSDHPFLNTQEMLWSRHWNYNAKLAQNKSIIFGHTPHPIDMIRKLIETGSKKIPLDNGCVFGTCDGYGNLLAFDIDSNELHVQPNVEP